MRITFVTDTYTPQPNGVATTLARLVEGLRERGHEVDVIRPSSLRAQEQGTEVPSLPLPGYAGVRLGLPRRLLLRWQWGKRRPDVIYVATESPLGVSAVSAALDMGIPVASGFHTNFQQYMAHYKLPFLERATMSVLRRMHNRSHCTFVPSTDTIRDLEGKGFEKLALLPKGVDTRLFHPRKRCAGLRRSWGLPEGGVAGLYVGRMAAEKNLPLVLRSFAWLQQHVPGFRGVFVGDGPLLDELRRSHPEFVFCGVQRGEELARHYASGDLFLFPSLTETFGNVTLEAMASGLVPVAYDYAAARQHVRHGASGFVAPFGDEEAWMEALQLAAEHAHDEELRSRARAKARKVRWRKVIKRFEKALVALTQGEMPVQLDEVEFDATPDLTNDAA